MISGKAAIVIGWSLLVGAGIVIIAYITPYGPKKWAMATGVFIFFLIWALCCAGCDGEC